MIKLCLLGFILFSHNSFGKIKIVTTFSVIENIVQQIGQDKVEIYNLVPAGVDPHLFEPKPKDVNSIKKSDLLFSNGLLFEPWIDRLLKATHSKEKAVILSQKINPRHIQNKNNIMTDPHAWNSPSNILTYLEIVVRNLSEKDPLNSRFYKSNADNLKGKIIQIRDKYKVKFSKIPRQQKYILTTHDAGFYLCEEFEIQSISPLGISTFGEINSKELMRILADIKKYNIKVLFTEKNQQQLLSERLAKKAQLKLGKQLYFDGLSVKSEPAADIISMFEYNLAQIYDSMNL